jgi:hypothetical protein
MCNEPRVSSAIAEPPKSAAANDGVTGPAPLAAAYGASAGANALSLDKGPAIALLPDPKAYVQPYPPAAAAARGLVPAPYGAPQPFYPPAGGWPGQYPGGPGFPPYQVHGHAGPGPHAAAGPYFGAPAMPQMNPSYCPAAHNGERSRAGLPTPPRITRDHE